MHKDDLLRFAPEEGALPFRLDAWRKLQSLPLPTSKDPLFRSFPFGRLRLPHQPASSLERSSTLPSADNPRIVFLNGHFSPELSRIPSPLIALPLTTALKTYGLFLHNRIARRIASDRDVLSLLQRAASPGGLFLYAPPAARLAAPLQILSIGEGHALPSIWLSLGANAELTVGHFEESSAFHGRLDLSLEPEARLTYALAAAPAETGLLHLNASLKRGAALAYSQALSGPALQRCSFSVELQEEGASATLSSLALPRATGEAHIQGEVRHLAPGCRSEQLFKHALPDHTRSRFSGKIYVAPVAQQTAAYQSSRALLLSPNASFQTSPNLEILADDVKASHGAAISRLSEEEQFYLQSRGLSPETAAALLIHAFCRPVVDPIPIPELRAAILRHICEIQ
jgi:Fe-S cluster assembly protein SufD